jgi:hypothetical protein
MAAHSAYVQFSIRASVFALVTLSLAACASGPRYGDAAAVHTLPHDKARLVVFRESHFAGSLKTARIKIDGRTVASLPNGAVLQVDHDPGHVEIGVDSLLDFGACEIRLEVNPQAEYFVEVGVYIPMSPVTMGLVPHLLITTNSTANRVCGGGWCAAVVEKREASARLHDLTLVTPTSTP